jgi:hypothetical protein
MNRQFAAVGTLAILTVLAGCAGPFGGGIDTTRANESVSYNWDTGANATYTVDNDRIRAVYAVENRSSIEIYGFRRFNNERPLDPVAVRFRYPNGTVVGPQALNFTTANSRTVISLPARSGHLGLVLPKTGKRVRTPTVVNGAHEVVLPPNAEVRYYLLGRVAPSADERFRDADGRVHLRWTEVAGERLVVEYYLERDLLIFAGILSIALLGVVGGLAYFWLQLRTLRDRREQVAWDEDHGGP